MSNAPQDWTVLSLLDWTTDHLTKRGFDEARLHVELLLAHTLHVKRLDLYLQFDRPLTVEERSQFRGLYERRLRHEPLQYILGETEFMGLRFAVSPAVLIPRPETELLVEEALSLIGRGTGRFKAILDIGCGAGNIGIPLAKKYPSIAIVALDRDAEVIAVAEENARSHGIANMTFECRDILTDVSALGPFDMILSNPPYIPAIEIPMLQEEVRAFEPRGALTDEGDGLALYRRIGALLPGLLNPGGVVGLEVGFDQASRVSEILLASGIDDIRRVRDFAGIDRVVIGERGAD